jgi:hypothetical protein
MGTVILTCCWVVLAGCAVVLVITARRGNAARQSIDRSIARMRAADARIYAALARRMRP